MKRITTFLLFLFCLLAAFTSPASDALKHHAGKAFLVKVTLFRANFPILLGETNTTSSNEVIMSNENVAQGDDEISKRNRSRCIDACSDLLFPFAEHLSISNAAFFRHLTCADSNKYILQRTLRI